MFLYFHNDCFQCCGSSSVKNKSHITKMYICSSLVQNVHCDVILHFASMLHVYPFDFIVIDCFSCFIIINNSYSNNLLIVIIIIIIIIIITK